MAKKTKVNYRKVLQEHLGYTKEQMCGYDVHHIDGNRDNNHPSNLLLVTPEEHAKLHQDDFVLWSRLGAKHGNESFRRRLAEQGPTEKEILYRRTLSEKLKSGGLHRKPHTQKTKDTISRKKKEHLKDKTKHPMWGRTTYELYAPDGSIHVVSGGWKEWCKSRGLSPSNLRLVAIGKRVTHKGWKAKVL